MLWYDITFSLDKAVSPSLQGSTALALFSAGKTHSADQPATANSSQSKKSLPSKPFQGAPFIAFSTKAFHLASWN